MPYVRANSALMASRTSTIATALLLAVVGLLVVGCHRAGASLPPNPNEAQDEWQTISHDGRERRYLVHKPAGWDGQRPLPVVIAFHGGGARAQVQRTQSGLNAKSNVHRFLVVYPDGTGPTIRRPGQGRVGIFTWNAGLCCGRAVEEGVDDVGFVRALLDDLPRHYAIDSSRIYATGMSNGSMMAHRVGVEIADRIAAIAPVAGAIMIEDLSLRPSRPVPILYFHGLQDPSARFNGGPGKLDKTVHRSVPETINWWVTKNRCNPGPVAIDDHGDYVLRRFEPPSGRLGAPVHFVLLPDGGHTWPGGVDVTAGMGTGKLIESVDASEMMWHFFARHRLHNAPRGEDTSTQPDAAAPVAGTAGDAAPAEARRPVLKRLLRPRTTD